MSLSKKLNKALESNLGKMEELIKRDLKTQKDVDIDFIVSYAVNMGYKAGINKALSLLDEEFYKIDSSKKELNDELIDEFYNYYLEDPDNLGNTIWHLIQDNCTEIEDTPELNKVIDVVTPTVNGLYTDGQLKGYQSGIKAILERLDIS